MASIGSRRMCSALVVAAVAMASHVGLSTARAGYIPGFVGSTTLGGGAGTANGIVNYAVFQNTTNDWLTALGVNTTTAIALAGTTINTTDQYVYMYEIVNTDAANNLAQLKVTFLNPDQTISSIGYFDHRVFLDGTNSQVGPPGHPSIVNGLTGTGTTSSGPAGPASINPGGANKNSGNNQASFDWTNQIPPAGFSSIVFVTTNVAPNFVPTSIRDNAGNQSVGLAPGVVPEPASSVMLLTGGGALVILVLQARRRPIRGDMGRS
jgi:hypothetical protein